MSNLAEFLLARIAEDEAVASLATESPWNAVSDDDGEPAISTWDYPSDRLFVRLTSYEDQDHVSRWAPARVLAECEAKRRIVEWSTETLERWKADAILMRLAAPYADHPDWREEWRV